MNFSTMLVKYSNCSWLSNWPMMEPNSRPVNLSEGK
jgi:hypothetical protein